MADDNDALRGMSDQQQLAELLNRQWALVNRPTPPVAVPPQERLPPEVLLDLLQPNRIGIDQMIKNLLEHTGEDPPQTDTEVSNIEKLARETESLDSDMEMMPENLRHGKYTDL